MNSSSAGLATFHEFFDHCVGTWNTERTYHYLTAQQVERSHTDFVISPLNAEQKQKVLADNSYDALPVAELPGFYLAFATVSETGEKVSQALNMLFVPRKSTGQSILSGELSPQGEADDDRLGAATLSGDYLRDRAYEESRPIISQFQFQPATRELLMTTTYTQVVSVDSITLINPSLRIRRIFNYRRPPAGEPLSELLLVGFGVEQKAN
jgi:CpeS-like protein